MNPEENNHDEANSLPTNEGHNPPQNTDNQPSHQPAPFGQAAFSANSQPTEPPMVAPTPSFEVEPSTTPVPVESPEAFPVVSDPQPGGQKPIRKNKKNLLVALIVGIVSLLVIVGAIVFYFVYWQNSEKMIADGVASVINAKTVATNTDISMKLEQGEIKVKIASANKEDSSKATVDLNVELKDAKPINLKLDGVFTDNGVVYVKAEGVKKAVEEALRATMAAQSQAYSSPYGSVAPSRVDDRQVNEMMKSLDPIIKKVDSRWIKIDPSDIAEVNKETGDMQKCMAETMKKFNTDKAMRDEVIEAYRDNPFLIAKKDVKVESYQGATGFELDTSDTTKKNAEAFSKRLSESKVAKELKACDKSAKTFEDDFQDTSRKASDSGEAVIRVWVTPFTHQLKRIEVTAKDSSSENSAGISEVVITSDFELNQLQTVEVPKDSVSVKDLQKEIEDVMRNMTGSPSYSSRQTDFDYNV